MKGAPALPPSRAVNAALAATLSLVAATLFLAPAPLRAVVDPFYTSRLQEGIAAVERGAYGEAAKSLRIACFGMLDDEPQLADCLVRLALAQAGAGDRESFAQTFQRLVEGEQLIGLYSKAGLDAELGRRFEAKVAEWIPRAAIAASPAFKRLAADQRESQLQALQPKARRERLAKLEKEEPKSARWPLLLARLEKEQRQPKPALAAASRALVLDSSLDEARCLRGWANAALGKFADAANDLAGCRASDPAFAVAELQSRVELGQWGEAEGLLAAMTPEQRQQPAVADLAKRVERGVARQQPSPARAAASPPAARPTPQPVPAGTNHGAAEHDGGRSAATRPAASTPAPRAAAATPAPRPAATKAPPRTAATTPPRSTATPPPPAPPAPTLAPAPAATAPPAAPNATPAPAAVAGGPPGGALASADETLLARAQSLLARARTAAEIEEAYGVAAELAARYPQHPRVQQTAAEIAYRASRWSDAVRHFRAGGDPGEAQPLLLFYYAVSLWESGARQEAAAVMRRTEGKLRPTPFVQEYRAKILGAAPSR
ncbi:MAG TPA: hypothetical protein VN923_10470 [Thermoanaerobaculia bacterium]|nr:hypothetical protein [Thermoanaerobaculia bacterium]